MSTPAERTVPTRRQFLESVGLATAALAAGPVLGTAGSANAAPAGPAFRLVHLTDIHLQPERRAPEGFAACLRHVQEHHRPQLILNTGDSIMDSWATDEARAKLQWDLWKSVWRDCGVPAEHCIGNHDIWGIDRDSSKATGSEPRFGKKWVMEVNGWERPYRSFDRGGWHIVALDSTMPVGEQYVGRLDEEQFSWLAEDLARVDQKTPVLIMSHIPLFSAAAFYDGENEKSGNWVVPAGIMHVDSRKLKDLFRKHPNVKLCLSGHLHLVDRVDYLGVTYLCNGAVSGGWWKGSHQECEPGYGVVDLYANGGFESKYVTYGWKAEA